LKACRALVDAGLAWRAGPAYLSGSLSLFIEGLGRFPRPAKTRGPTLHRDNPRAAAIAFIETAFVELGGQGSAQTTSSVA
jgi:hypothetical protein